MAHDLNARIGGVTLGNLERCIRRTVIHDHDLLDALLKKHPPEQAVDPTEKYLDLTLEETFPLRVTALAIARELIH